MRIYKPPGITRGQIILVSVIGVLGGVYIWKPLFADFFKEQNKLAESTSENRVE